MYKHIITIQAVKPLAVAPIISVTIDGQSVTSGTSISRESGSAIPVIVKSVIDNGDNIDASNIVETIKNAEDDSLVNNTLAEIMSLPGRYKIEYSIADSVAPDDETLKGKFNFILEIVQPDAVPGPTFANNQMTLSTTRILASDNLTFPTADELKELLEDSKEGDFTIGTINSKLKVSNGKTFSAGRGNVLTQIFDATNSTTGIKNTLTNIVVGAVNRPEPTMLVYNMDVSTINLSAMNSGKYPYVATDIIDGDLTDDIELSIIDPLGTEQIISTDDYAKFGTSKYGPYQFKYSVTDSEHNTLEMMYVNITLPAKSDLETSTVSLSVGGNSATFDSSNKLVKGTSKAYVGTLYEPEIIHSEGSTLKNVILKHTQNILNKDHFELINASDIAQITNEAGTYSIIYTASSDPDFTDESKFNVYYETVTVTSDAKPIITITDGLDGSYTEDTPLTFIQGQTFPTFTATSSEPTAQITTTLNGTVVENLDDLADLAIGAHTLRFAQKGAESVFVELTLNIVENTKPVISVTLDGSSVTQDQSISLESGSATPVIVKSVIDNGDNIDASNIVETIKNAEDDSLVNNTLAEIMSLPGRYKIEYSIADSTDPSNELLKGKFSFILEITLTDAVPGPTFANNQLTYTDIFLFGTDGQTPTVPDETALRALIDEPKEVVVEITNIESNFKMSTAFGINTHNILTQKFTATNKATGESNNLTNIVIAAHDREEPGISAYNTPTDFINPATKGMPFYKFAATDKKDGDVSSITTSYRIDPLGVKINTPANTSIYGVHEFVYEVTDADNYSANFRVINVTTPKMSELGASAINLTVHGNSTSYTSENAMKINASSAYQGTAYEPVVVHNGTTLKKSIIKHTTDKFNSEKLAVLHLDATDQEVADITNELGKYTIVYLASTDPTFAVANQNGLYIETITVKDAAGKPTITISDGTNNYTENTSLEFIHGQTFPAFTAESSESTAEIITTLNDIPVDNLDGLADLPVGAHTLRFAQKGAESVFVELTLNIVANTAPIISVTLDGSSVTQDQSISLESGSAVPTIVKTVIDNGVNIDTSNIVETIMNASDDSLVNKSLTEIMSLPGRYKIEYSISDSTDPSNELLKGKFSFILEIILTDAVPGPTFANNQRTRTDIFLFGTDGPKPTVPDAVALRAWIDEPQDVDIEITNIVSKFKMSTSFAENKHNILTQTFTATNKVTNESNELINIIITAHDREEPGISAYNMETDFINPNAKGQAFYAFAATDKKEGDISSKTTSYRIDPLGAKVTAPASTSIYGVHEFVYEVTDADSHSANFRVINVTTPKMSELGASEIDLTVHGNTTSYFNEKMMNINLSTAYQGTAYEPVVVHNGTTLKKSIIKHTLDNFNREKLAVLHLDATDQQVADITNELGKYTIVYLASTDPTFAVANQNGLYIETITVKAAASKPTITISDGTNNYTENISLEFIHGQTFPAFTAESSEPAAEIITTLNDIPVDNLDGLADLAVGAHTLRFAQKGAESAFVELTLNIVANTAPIISVTLDGSSVTQDQSISLESGSAVPTIVKTVIDNGVNIDTSNIVETIMNASDDSLVNKSLTEIMSLPGRYKIEYSIADTTDPSNELLKGKFSFILEITEPNTAPVISVTLNDTPIVKDSTIQLLAGSAVPTIVKTVLDNGVNIERPDIKEVITNTDGNTIVTDLATIMSTPGIYKIEYSIADAVEPENEELKGKFSFNIQIIDSNDAPVISVTVNGSTVDKDTTHTLPAGYNLPTIVKTVVDDGLNIDNPNITEKITRIGDGTVIKRLDDIIYKAGTYTIEYSIPDSTLPDDESLKGIFTFTLEITLDGPAFTDENGARSLKQQSIYLFPTLPDKPDAAALATLISDPDGSTFAAGDILNLVSKFNYAQSFAKNKPNVLTQTFNVTKNGKTNKLTNVVVTAIDREDPGMIVYNMDYQFLNVANVNQGWYPFAATDKKDGDLSPVTIRTLIDPDGNESTDTKLKTSKFGVYQFLYDVMDSDGNSYAMQVLNITGPNKTQFEANSIDLSVNGETSPFASNGLMAVPASSLTHNDNAELNTPYRPVVEYQDGAHFNAVILKEGRNKHTKITLEMINRNASLEDIANISDELGTYYIIYMASTDPNFAAGSNTEMFIGKVVVVNALPHITVTAGTTEYTDDFSFEYYQGVGLTKPAWNATATLNGADTPLTTTITKDGAEFTGTVDSITEAGVYTITYSAGSGTSARSVVCTLTVKDAITWTDTSSFIDTYVVNDPFAIPEIVAYDRDGNPVEDVKIQIVRKKSTKGTWYPDKDSIVLEREATWIAADYEIVCTARDSFGIGSRKVMPFTVTDTQAPEILYNGEIVTGTTVDITLKKDSVYVPNVIADDNALNAKFSRTISLNYNSVTDKGTDLKSDKMLDMTDTVGTHRILYKINDGAKEVTFTLMVTVSDELAPATTVPMPVVTLANGNPVVAGSMVHMSMDSPLTLKYPEGVRIEYPLSNGVIYHPDTLTNLTASGYYAVHVIAESEDKTQQNVFKFTLNSADMTPPTIYKDGIHLPVNTTIDLNIEPGDTLRTDNFIPLDNSFNYFQISYLEKSGEQILPLKVNGKDKVSGTKQILDSAGKVMSKTTLLQYQDDAIKTGEPVVVKYMARDWGSKENTITFNVNQIPAEGGAIE